MICAIRAHDADACVALAISYSYIVSFNTHTLLHTLRGVSNVVYTRVRSTRASHLLALKLIPPPRRWFKDSVPSSACSALVSRPVFSSQALALCTPNASWPLLPLHPTCDQPACLPQPNDVRWHFTLSAHNKTELSSLASRPKSWPGVGVLSKLHMRRKCVKYKNDSWQLCLTLQADRIVVSMDGVQFHLKSKYPKAKCVQKQMRYLFCTVHINNVYNYPFHVLWTQGYWRGWLPPCCCWSWPSPLVYWPSWLPSAPRGVARTWRRRPVPLFPMRTISTMRLQRETVCGCSPAQCMPLLRKQSATRELCVRV